MKKMTLKVTLLAALMATAGIAVAADKAPTEAEKKAAAEHAKKMVPVNAEIKAANAALDKAAKVGGEWRDAR